MADTDQVVKEPDLKTLISELASVDPLTDEQFAQFGSAVYSTKTGATRLRSVLSDWETLSESMPSKPVASLFHGYAQFLLGDFESASAEFKAAKGSAWGALYHARCLVELGESRKALKAAKDCFTKHDEFLPAGYMVVQLLCASGQAEQTEEVMKKLEAKDGESSAFAWASGLCLEKNGEYREAIANFRRALELDESNEEASFRLGYLLDLYGTDEEEKGDEAVQAYERCLSSVPMHTNAVINLGLLYEDRERYHDAVKCFEAVLRRHPTHARAKLYLDDAVAATQMFYDKEQEKKADRHSQVLKIPVSDFELSVRSRNCLAKMNIDSLGDLIMKTEQELLSYKNFGETSLQEIKEMLSQKGLRLGQGLEDSGADLTTGRNPLEATAPSETLDKPIEDLNLSVRSRRCMERLNVRTVRDLINKTEVELMSAKNFGMTSLNEINMKLRELGLALRS